MVLVKGRVCLAQLIWRQRRLRLPARFETIAAAEDEAKAVAVAESEAH